MRVVQKILNDSNKFGFMGWFKALKRKNQSSNIPNFLKDTAETPGDKFSCNLEDDLGCFRIIHGKQVHYLAEHLMRKRLRTHFDKS